MGSHICSGNYRYIDRIILKTTIVVLKPIKAIHLSFHFLIRLRNLVHLFLFLVIYMRPTMTLSRLYSLTDSHRRLGLFFLHGLLFFLIDILRQVWLNLSLLSPLLKEGAHLNIFWLVFLFKGPGLFGCEIGQRLPKSTHVFTLRLLFIGYEVGPRFLALLRELAKCMLDYSTLTDILHHTALFVFRGPLNV